MTNMEMIVIEIQTITIFVLSKPAKTSETLLMFDAVVGNVLAALVYQTPNQFMAKVVGLLDGVQLSVQQRVITKGNLGKLV